MFFCSLGAVVDKEITMNSRAPFKVPVGALVCVFATATFVVAKSDVLPWKVYLITEIILGAGTVVLAISWIVGKAMDRYYTRKIRNVGESMIPEFRREFERYDRIWKMRLGRVKPIERGHRGRILDSPWNKDKKD